MSDRAKESIERVVQSIFDAGQKEAEDLFDLIKNEPAVSDAVGYLMRGQLDEFDILFASELTGVVEAVIAGVTKNPSAVFLVLHHEFVYAHVSKMIEDAEGHPCSADKASTIVGALYRHLMVGDAIAFNYEQQYTFHLPKKIFKTQAEIVGFFESLQSLYYGNPDRYLNEILKVRRVLKGD